MDSSFAFLSEPDRGLLKDILSRRNPGLATQLGHAPTASREDVTEVLSIISDELTDHLDADWEPTEHGKRVSELLARVNARRIQEWPV